jgi:16S rRNA (uracil1498-N3)-methyltransferase
VPTITAPQSLASLLKNRTTDIVVLMLTERRRGTSLQILSLSKEPTASVLIVIGPEGGWSQEEVAQAEQAGVQSITLGLHILRAETAALAALSIVQSRLGNLE